jgi:hypothetical protein
VALPASGFPEPAFAFPPHQSKQEANPTARLDLELGELLQQCSTEFVQRTNSCCLPPVAMSTWPVVRVDGIQNGIST